jgi:hypothetical protein
VAVDTGIYIKTEELGVVDIGDDNVPSEVVTNWLRSRGGYNPFAENLLLAFISKEQTAHKVAFTVDVGEATYQHASEHMQLIAHDEGITLLTSCAGDTTSCDVPVDDVRVYNALILLIRAIQVHYEEQQPHEPAGYVGPQSIPKS